MLGRRNKAANDIVCPVLALERLRSEADSDTFIANGQPYEGMKRI